MTRLHSRAILLAAAAFASRGLAYDTLRYADPDGTEHTVQVEDVSKRTSDELRARVRIGGRLRRLDLPARQVIEFRRGDSDAKNQWSKSLARGLRMMAAGQLATQGTVPGAEELFVKVAYSTEAGTQGQEESERVDPWHNMYATFYLVECRYRMGKAGDAAKFQAALDTIAEFRKRTEAKDGGKVKMQVPGEKGQMFEGDVYGWGDNQLSPEVGLLEGRIHAAMKNVDAAKAAYDAVIESTKKRPLPPHLLAAAVNEKAEVEAEGLASDKQEALHRAAGNTLASLGGQQPDAYGRGVLSRAANRALLRGADLLLASAEQKAASWDLPLTRYRQLRDNEGRNDPVLRIGAEAGIGICLTEKGEGEEAYKTLLRVVVEGYQHPEQMARALFYLGKAAPLYAAAIEKAGGNGAFLREEGPRWWADLKERYPTSKWAKEAPAK
jgi:hypothetical protein